MSIRLIGNSGRIIHDSGDILIWDHAEVTPGIENDPTHTVDTRFASTEIYGMGVADTVYGLGQRANLFDDEGDDTIHVGRDIFSNYDADGSAGLDTLSFEFRKAMTEQWVDGRGGIVERDGDEAVSLTFRSNGKGDFANYSDDPADRGGGWSFVDFEE